MSNLSRDKLKNWFSAPYLIKGVILTNLLIGLFFIFSGNVLLGSLQVMGLLYLLLREHYLPAKELEWQRHRESHQSLTDLQTKYDQLKKDFDQIQKDLKQKSKVIEEVSLLIDSDEPLFRQECRKNILSIHKESLEISKKLKKLTQLHHLFSRLIASDDQLPVPMTQSEGLVDIEKNLFDLQLHSYNQGRNFDLDFEDRKKAFEGQERMLDSLREEFMTLQEKFFGASRKQTERYREEVGRHNKARQALLQKSFSKLESAFAQICSQMETFGFRATKIQAESYQNHLQQLKSMTEFEQKRKKGLLRLIELSKHQNNRAGRDSSKKGVARRNSLSRLGLS